jgi:hypothetical protein
MIWQLAGSLPLMSQCDLVSSHVGFLFSAVVENVVRQAIEGTILDIFAAVAGAKQPGARRSGETTTAYQIGKYREEGTS